MKVEKALSKGAEANGYPNEVWTLPRAAEVIQRVTGVSYHPGYVWYILRKQLGWTWQRPSRRAVERDDEAIEQWVKQRWPQLRAPRGHTPVLRHALHWKRLSLAAALVYEPDGSDAHPVFELRPGAYNGDTLIEFLIDLHELEPGRRMLLLWDGLPAHRSRCMTDWLNAPRTWLSVERLPGYAPELNPAEQVFGNLKSTELANLCRTAINEVQAIAEDGLDRIGTDTQLCFAFLRHAGLKL